jgi:hypothetical protein
VLPDMGTTHMGQETCGVTVTKMGAAFTCLALVACASTSDGGLENSLSSPNPSQVICKYEKPIGSNVPRRVCRTRAEIEREAQQTRRVLHEMPRTPKSNI